MKSQIRIAVSVYVRVAIAKKLLSLHASLYCQRKIPSVSVKNSAKLCLAKGLWRFSRISGDAAT